MRHLFAALIVITVALSLFPAESFARPQYNKAFKETYAGIKAPINCGVCHGDGGKEKTKQTLYAKDLAGSLGIKNQRAPNKILDALRDAEGKEAEPGKTWGDYLNNGLLPPP